MTSRRWRRDERGTVVLFSLCLFFVFCFFFFVFFLSERDTIGPCVGDRSSEDGSYSWDLTVKKYQVWRWPRGTTQLEWVGDFDDYEAARAFVHEKNADPKSDWAYGIDVSARPKEQERREHE